MADGGAEWRMEDGGAMRDAGWGGRLVRLSTLAAGRRGD
ncbi:MAG: hypothetical protein QOD80_1014 [Verrucomicrobiota bacterium]